MKYFYACCFFFLTCFTAAAQTLSVSGACISGTMTLSKVANQGGKVAYEGYGTVMGSEGVLVDVLWMPSPDLVWVVAFDGQPYFQNSCNTISGPPITGTTFCPWTAVTGMACTGGTPLSIGGTGVVPVKLISFTASLVNGNVQLAWKTATETNNKGFEIQRSADGISWTKIGFKNGALNSNAELSYSYTDESPLSGKSYYRLNQYDLDNKQTVSSVATIDLATTAGYSLKNNNNGIFQLTIQSAEPMEVSVLDLGGRRLIHTVAAQGVHQLDLSKYASGVYLLEMRKNNKSIIEKLIKR